MSKFKFLRLISITFFLFIHNDARAQNSDAASVGKCLKVLTDVMIHDITSPLVAGRNYAYTIIAFYEGVRNADSNYNSYAGQLNGLKPLPAPATGVQYDWFTVGTTAFYNTGYAFVFSKDLFQKAWDSLDIVRKRKIISKEVLNRSVKYGELIAAHILQWANEDHYLATRTLSRFTPSKVEGSWQQTAPDYMEAIEPNWNQIRTMVLKSPGEISIPIPANYKSEKFLAACREVYDIKNSLTKKQEWIANFWDCNPFATQTVGHLIYSVKKITPGGHWIGICGIAIHQTKQNLLPALATYSLVSIALFDAFIACWDIKYKTNYIRPVTAIQHLIAPNWEPVLQTPPFPEYPSGHSVVSMASAVVLSNIYGNSFNYIDDSEKQFGIESRPFSSFFEAAEEAAISRMYGGIHFREAIENGSELGKKIGVLITTKIKLIRDR